MSASYYIYTEMLINGKWESVCPYAKNIKRDKLSMIETYYSGSRSYFNETFEKLREIGINADKNTVSEEISSRHSESWNNDNYPYVFVVDYDVFKKYTPKNNEKEMHGYVSKNDVFNYEKGELDEIWNYLNINEYRELTPEEKEYYRYYEWNSFSGWYYFFGKIKKSADKQVEDFCDINCIWDTCSQTRLVIVAYP